MIKPVLLALLLTACVESEEEIDVDPEPEIPTFEELQLDDDVEPAAQPEPYYQEDDAPETLEDFG